MIPTAQSIFEHWRDNQTGKDIPDLMIEFAKLHVQEALKQVSKEAEAYYYDESGDEISATVNKQSILNAYPLNLIK